MCLPTIQKEPKIANSTITIYKLFNSNTTDKQLKKGILVSNFRYYDWHIGKMEEAEMTIDNYDQSSLDGDDGSYVNELARNNNTSINWIAHGLHAFTKLLRLIRFCYFKDGVSYNIIGKGYIPKGAEYYTTGEGCIVSNKMKITKTIKINKNGKEIK